MAARHRLPPDLAVTGLHQLDGARYLRDARHADAMLCRLVAYHSCAIIEAGERGLADVLSSEFDPAPYVLGSVLTCCDMTASPDCESVPVEQRLAEIHDRYGAGRLVSRSMQRATPMILRSRAGPSASRPEHIVSLLVESGPGADALTCEEARFNETPTARDLTQSGLWRRNAPSIGSTVRGYDLRSLIRSGPPRQE